MPEVAAPCLRGCSKTGQHQPDCLCGAEGGDDPPRTHEHGEDCPRCSGCLPRPAVKGGLCQPDVGRLTRALLGMADLASWIRTNRTPGTWRPGRGDVLREAPAPLEIAAVDDADEMHSTLARWTALYCSEVPMAGPPWLGSDVRPAARRIKAGWHLTSCSASDCPGCWVEYVEARVVGLRSTASASMAIGGLAGWVLTHLEGVLERDWAGDLYGEVTDVYRAADARWPRSDRERKLPLPCPECQRVMLFMHPPAEERHPVTVVCHREECGHVLTESDYLLKAQIAFYERTGKAVVNR